MDDARAGKSKKRQTPQFPARHHYDQENTDVAPAPSRIRLRCLPRRSLFAAVAMLTPGIQPALAADPAWAPTRPVRIVVGAAAGGSTDIVARFVAERLTGPLGQAVVVENRAGASGAIAGEFVTQQPADGHVFMVATGGTHAINPALQPSTAFEPVRDSIGVAGIGRVNHIVVVNPQLPVRSIPELVAYARANPGRVAFGSAGVGGPIHLAGEMFRLRAGADITHVPYRGSGPMVVDLIAGNIQLAFDNLPSSIGAARSGQLRALAVTSEERWPGVPELPTMAEAGMADFVVTSWFGLAARRGTPSPVIDRISAEVAKVLADPAAATRMEQLGALPMPMEAEAFNRFITAEQTRWRTVIQQGGITAN